MTDDKLLMIGWKPFFQQQVATCGSVAVKVARVSSHHGTRVLLLGEHGEFSVPVQSAEAVGGIAVGDWLVLDANKDRALQRLERQAVLLRKASGEEVKPQVIASNIDTLFITTSCNEEFNLSRIERYLALALEAGIRPVVVLTKADLCDAAVEYRRQAEQLHPGLVVESLDALSQALNLCLELLTIMVDKNVVEAQASGQHLEEVSGDDIKSIKNGLERFFVHYEIAAVRLGDDKSRRGSVLDDRHLTGTLARLK